MPEVINLRQQKEEPVSQPQPTVAAAPQSAGSPIAQYILEMRKNMPTALSWEMPVVYRNSPKTHFTLFILGLIAFAIILFLIQGDMLLPALFSLAAIALLFNGSRKPTTAKITINQAGVSIDDYHHRFNELHSFHIHHFSDEHKELSIKTTKWYQPYIKIPLEGQDSRQVHNLMLQFVPEEEHEISLTEHLARRI